MYMDVGLDTGNMILKDEVTIEENDNFENIHDKLGLCGAELLIRTIALIKDGNAPSIPQDDSLSSYAAKIEKSDCLIDFDTDAKTVHDLIRGLPPIPLSFTHTPDGRLLKIIESRYSNICYPAASSGEVVSTDDGAITVACKSGSVKLLRVLPEGKGRMSAADFIRGRKISVGDILK